MNRKYTVELIPHNMLTNCYWFLITDTRTGKTWQHYAQEFCYGQMHYDESTDNFPLYVHDEIWRLAK